MRASGTGGILAIWHDKTILPIYQCRHKGLWAIISLSKDGELQNRLVMSRGYQTIRGSSGAKGVRAFLGAARRIKEGAIIAITPDGPRGPAKIVQAGTVLLAGKAGCEVMPVGIACYPSWRMNSWDKHCIPKPFGKAVIVFGEPLRVDHYSTEEEQQVWAERIAEALNNADAEAEAILFGKEKQDVRAV
jgi:lysophospholipid acyltransferase (LPLAT)-like uncharacterized protein